MPTVILIEENGTMGLRFNLSLTCYDIIIIYYSLHVHTRQNHSKVLELLNQQLSHVASSPSPPHSDRERLQTLAISIAERYKNQPKGHSAGRQLSQTFFLLLDIMQFFDHYHSKRIDVALDVSHPSSCWILCENSVV